MIAQSGGAQPAAPHCQGELRRQPEKNKKPLNGVDGDAPRAVFGIFNFHVRIRGICTATAASLILAQGDGRGGAPDRYTYQQHKAIGQLRSVDVKAPSLTSAASVESDPESPTRQSIRPSVGYRERKRNAFLGVPSAGVDDERWPSSSTICIENGGVGC